VNAEVPTGIRNGVHFITVNCIPFISIDKHMKIDNLKTGRKMNRARVSATVNWEDTNRPAKEVYFEVTEEFADGLSCNPDAFLVACILPAMRHGEERISLDEEICPELREGLITVMSWLRHWYGAERNVVRIEAKTRSRVKPTCTPTRAGMFLSGGIDSLATLRLNRLNFASEHVGSVKDGVIIYGLEVDQPDRFALVLDTLSTIAKDTGLTLIPVYTNVRYLDEDWSFWRDEFQGAALAAVGHALRRRLTTVSIAATFDIPNIGPWGSHPLLDPNFSSSDVRIRHEGVELSRLAKTRVVTNWDVGLQSIRVCNKTQYYQPGKLNCGDCEKCVRTMLALLAVGVLNRTRAFPINDISEEQAAAVWINDPYEESCYRDLIEPLTDNGRLDLVRGIKRAINRYHGKVDLKTRIAGFDRNYLGGNLRKVRRLMLS